MKLVFLGRLAALAGTAWRVVALNGPLGWNELIERLEPSLADAVRSHRVRVAQNGKVLGEKSSLVAETGDEIAFLPPVSGG